MPLSAETEHTLQEAINALLANRPLPAGAQLVPASTAARVARLDSADGSFYIKIFLPHKRLERVKQWLRGSRAERAQKAAQDLERAGFATPAVLLAGREGGVSWMVSRAVPGVGLADYINTFLRGPLSRDRLRWKRRILRGMGELIGSLHEKGIVHGDLRLNNILIDGHASVPRFFLVDNERNDRFPKTIPLRLQVKNLVQVRLLYPPFGTRSDCLRFYRAYRKARPHMSEIESRILLNAVERTYQRRFKRLAGKSQRLTTDKVAIEDVSNVPA